MRRAVARLALALVLYVPLAAAAATVVAGEIRGAIGPASAAYLDRMLAHASGTQAELVVLALDTPGGLDTSMRDMIRAVLASPVPVAVFVSPRGGRAASAGTYLLYASHIAAMAPGTNVGAATPVAIGVGGGDEGPGSRKPPAGKGKDKEPPADAGTDGVADPSRAKAVHDAVAYLQSLAEMRGRNPEWARKAVLDADSIPATEALKLRVIDVVAADLADLLKQVDGREVEAAGQTRKLALAGAEVQTFAPNAKERLLAVIANPNVALLLLMAGIYGLLIEFYVPGTALPGTIGAISLLLGLYGLALLPITFAGAALIALGVLLMVAEAFAPSFGALGLGGGVAFVAGALLLVDDVPGFTVAWEAVVPLAVVNVLLILAIAAMAMRSRRAPGVSGVESMIGTTAEALEDFEREGWVLAHGERWHARSAGALRKGGRARITGLDGLVLLVEPVPTQGA